MNKDMPTEWNSMEEKLARLAPGPLDEGLLRRLECCAAGDWTTLTAGERCFEVEARKFVPAAFDGRQMERFANVFAGVSFGGAEKVAVFPAPRRAPIRKTRPVWWSAAAGVALLGASAALLVPGRVPGNRPLETSVVTNTPGTAAAAKGFMPTSFDSDLSNVSDKGVVWSKDSRPFRVLKVDYTDRVSLTNPTDGRVYEVEQPRTKYRFVPISGN